MTTANEVLNEARHIADAPAVAPGAQPEPLILAELVRNLASLVVDLAGLVEELESGEVAPG